MTRTRTIATLWCTALAAALAVYGCGSSSTVDTGTGGRAGGTGGSSSGSGGGIVIINTGGMTGSGGMTGGGMGGMVGGGMGGAAGPVDAGAPMCSANAVCTAGFTCTVACNAGGGRGPGTQMCTCRNNNRLNCAACAPNDAGAPPPPMDAAPRDVAPPVDAGPVCANNVNNGTACMVGVSISPCARNRGGNMQTCTCAAVVVPPPPADAGPDAGPADAGMMARYTCM